MKTFTERYQSGDFEGVWSDLRDLGAKVWDDAGVLEDARTVARLAMERVKYNIETIVARLHGLGYVFDTPDEVHILPSNKTAAMVKMMETATGELPITLKTWFEVVGLVNMNGYLPLNGGDRMSWTHHRYPDPLIIEFWLDYFQEEYAVWQADLAEDPENAVQRFPLYIAPDEYHKEDVSGGPPYTIYLPNRCVDPPIENLWFEATFIQYLQRCMKWGGFPGFSRYDFAPMKVIEKLRVDLLPF